MQHSEIFTYNRAGELIDQKSGIWMGKTEVNTPLNVLTLASQKNITLQTIDFTSDCSEFTYCNLPVVTPRTIEYGWGFFLFFSMGVFCFHLFVFVLLQVSDWLNCLNCVSWVFFRVVWIFVSFYFMWLCIIFSGYLHNLHYKIEKCHRHFLLLNMVFDILKSSKMQWNLRNKFCS